MTDYNSRFTGQQIDDQIGITYPVVDTTIADHGNAATVGSIAYQLAAASAAGGGVVKLAAGTYTVTSAALTIGKNVTLSGSGQDATIIDQNHATANGIVIDTGTDGIWWEGILECLTILMPTSGSAGDGLVLTSTRSGGSTIRDLIIEGGVATSWGIQHNANNTTSYDNVKIRGGMNGFNMNLTGALYNYGDCSVSNLDISLSLANTIGIQLDGVSKALNNIFFNRVEIAASSLSGQVGLSLVANCTRNTFIHMDFENIEEDIQILASTVLDNTFIHCFRPSAFGVISTDYTYFGANNFIGGDADDYKLLSTVVNTVNQVIVDTGPLTIDKFLHGYKTILNTGATGTSTYTLPDATSFNQGATEVSFYAHTAQAIALVLADAGDRILDPTGAQRTTWTSDGSAGAHITLKSLSFNRWVVTSQTGTWS